MISQILKLHETEDIRFLQKFTDFQMKSRVVHVKSGPSSLVNELKAKAQFLTPATCKLLKQQIELIPQAAKYEIDVEHGTVTYRKSQ